MDSVEPFSHIPDEPLYNIKAVAQATGIEPVTLRAWERRYGIPKPTRTDTGYRLYSERDVAILRWLQSQIDAGMTIRHAIAMLHSLRPQSLPDVPHVAVMTPPMASFDAMVESLLGAGQEFDAPLAHQVIAQAFALFSIEDVCLHVLLPTLSRVGAQWRVGQVSLQSEHFLTNLIRQQLLALVSTMPPASRDGRVIVGCAPGDWHEMGVLVLSLFLRRQGWDVIYLGQAVGLHRLEEALTATQADGVILSASTFETIGHLPAASELVQHASKGRVWFAYGGSLFPHLSGLIERLPGIYIGDSLQEAVQRVSGLLAGTRQPAPRTAMPVSEQVATARQAVYAALLQLTAHLTDLVKQANPSPDLVAADEIAHEAMMGLLTALQFEYPAMLAAPPYLAVGSLVNYGVPTERIREVFSHEIDLHVLATLEPYLEHL